MQLFCFHLCYVFLMNSWCIIYTDCLPKAPKCLYVKQRPVDSIDSKTSFLSLPLFYKLYYTTFHVEKTLSHVTQNFPKILNCQFLPQIYQAPSLKKQFISDVTKHHDTYIDVNWEWRFSCTHSWRHTNSRYPKWSTLHPDPFKLTESFTLIKGGGENVWSPEQISSPCRREFADAEYESFITYVYLCLLWSNT